MSLKDISPQGASFEFGGKIRKMVFINKAVQYLKEKHNGFIKAINKIDDENGEFDFDVLTDILYAGFMINKDPELTQEYIRSELDLWPIYKTKEFAGTHLFAAITGVYPEPEKKEGEGKNE